MIKEFDLPSSVVNKKILKRFDQRQTVFGRMQYDNKTDFYKKGVYDNVEQILLKHKEGYSRVEFAEIMGSWTVYDYFHYAFSWDKRTDANSIMKKPTLRKYPIKDKRKMTNEVKKISKIYGASLAGITQINHDWVYSKDIDGKVVIIPKEYEFAIVMAIRMDPVAIKTSPAFTACIETGLAYSHIASCISYMAEFIRSLGYKAIPMGNDTALSIPLAIDAGLGELGRNGLLITPEYGPCIRICKVFTDIPLETDKPIEFGVTEFCKECIKCAEACHADAIQREKDPSFEITCPSNNPGILRWSVNHDKCYKFWIENGGECSSCIAACPFITRNLSEKL